MQVFEILSYGYYSIQLRSEYYIWQNSRLPCEYLKLLWKSREVVVDFFSVGVCVEASGSDLSTYYNPFWSDHPAPHNEYLDIS